MKGPSLDAIRKFKEQQERKKQLEDEKKIKEKLSTLEHRANQGDRKAKLELKRLDMLKEQHNKAVEFQRHQSSIKQSSSKQSTTFNNKNCPPVGTSKSSSGPAKPKKVETDFEELMRLAKQNSNEIKKPPQPPPPKPPEVKLEKKDKIRKPVIATKKPTDLKLKRDRETMQNDDIAIIRDRQHQRLAKDTPIKHGPALPIKKPSQVEIPRPKQTQYNKVPITSATQPSVSYMRKPQNMVNHHKIDYRNRYQEEEEDYDDEYEEDDFVVDEGEEDAQDELRKTLKSVFRYDRRRCDLREEELDRQYRAIGRVSTFEDLEREERRASRLAAEEDSRALREEEERKRLKKMRLKGKA